MSELDHGMFFTTQRISDVENLVFPMRNGLCSQKYKPVDYKHLHELAAEEKLTSAKIQLKIKKIEQVSKINKEQMLLKQHRQVWWQEHKRLSENRQKAEAEMKTFLDEESHKHNFFLDMRDLEHKLSKERDTYQRDTVVPVWQLKERLKFRLSEVQRYLSEESCLKSKIDPVEVLQQIKFVKKQQKAILEFLILESLALEKELEDYITKVLVHSFEEEEGLFLEVPSALLSLECPYPDLKALVINEYRKLASGYWSKLQEIDQQLKVLYRNTEWTEEVQWVFQTVINQYPGNLQNRRTLYLDVLQRYLPHKSRHELVLQWKAQEEEATEREAAVAARRKEKKDEEERLQKEREMIHRAQEKEKVKKYRAEKQLKWQEQEEKDLQHLKELRKLMAEQAVKDRERVKYRQALLERQLLEKKELALQEAREEEKKKKRLEALRQQVAIAAKSDPARVVADTVASKARMGIGTKEEFGLQKPLFKLHTYSEQQVISDPRLRVELALREAGLHKTLYAKEILPKIPPLKLPRRDMESTVFKT
ncbi:coiled-coil domain-containing protein 148 isoform X2 [Falco peregrinus]|uniref:coiled-coil domain-containing protein 148 isoform X2 n=1 Tax=Falco peregrinus TaxID=8954 RepID=UPI000FFC95E4|nr:coiled-coil domain-containing protein 148 isoform X2 [Falco peregrinus]